LVNKIAGVETLLAIRKLINNGSLIAYALNAFPIHNPNRGKGESLSIHT